MNGIWLWIKELVQRLSEDSPKFFKSLRWTCLALFILLTGLLIVDQNYPLGLDNVIFGSITWFYVITNITTGIGFVFGFTFLPKKDPVVPVIEKPEKENVGG